MKKLHELRLHEEMNPASTYNPATGAQKVWMNILRVPNGWIYTNSCGENEVSSVFVPYTEEFKGKE